MKKTVLALLLLCAAGAAAFSQAPEPASSFQYDLMPDESTWGEGVFIKKYVGTNRNLVIPATIEGYPVLVISDIDIAGNAGKFIDDPTLLTSVTIPEGVRAITGFRGQRNLTQATLPSTLRIIGDSIFEGSGLRTIKIPDSVEAILDSAFQDCVNLTEANIPAGIKFIGPDAFAGCSRLSNLIIPPGIASIERLIAGSFQGCALSLATRRRLVELGYPNNF